MRRRYVAFFTCSCILPPRYTWIRGVALPVNRSTVQWFTLLYEYSPFLYVVVVINISWLSYECINMMSYRFFSSLAGDVSSPLLSTASGMNTMIEGGNDKKQTARLQKAQGIAMRESASEVALKMDFYGKVRELAHRLGLTHAMQVKKRNATGYVVGGVRSRYLLGIGLRVCLGRRWWWYNTYLVVFLLVYKYTR